MFRERSLTIEFITTTSSAHKLQLPKHCFDDTLRALSPPIPNRQLTMTTIVSARLTSVNSPLRRIIANVDNCVVGFAFSEPLCHQRYVYGRAFWLTLLTFFYIPPAFCSLFSTHHRFVTTGLSILCSRCP